MPDRARKSFGHSERVFKRTSEIGRSPTVPHVIVKLWPGKTEQQKKRLVEAIVKDVTSVLHYGDESVSLAIEEIDSEEWRKKVYQPDILDNGDKLYKKPGYRM